MGKARPAAAGIKFVGRAEQGFAADDVHINAGFEQVVVFVAEGVFGRAFLGNLVLLFGQEAFEFGSAGFLYVAASKPLPCGAALVLPGSGSSALRMSMWQ